VAVTGATVANVERASIQICRVLLWNGTKAGHAATRRYQAEQDNENDDNNFDDDFDNDDNAMTADSDDHY